MEDEKIDISIIMTSYNYESLISEAIESLLNQTYQNWELIIVDDGSVDNSVEVIKKYCEKDNRIKLYSHENGENKGLTSSLLLGLEKVSNEWLAFLESDDVWELNYLDEKVKAIKANKDAGLIFNDVKLIGDETRFKEFDEYFRKRTKLLSAKNIEYTELLDINFITTFSCVMVKKSLLEKCEFKTPMPQCIDWVLWIQIIQNNKIIYIKKELTHWRLHTKSYMNELNIEKRHKLFAQLFKYLNRNKNSILISLYSFINIRRIEKLLRPQVRALSALIRKCLLSNKFIDLSVY